MLQIHSNKITMVTHQDPGMLTHMAEKKGKYVREYIPCDTNTLLAVGDKAFTERNVINLMVTSKHPRFQWFTVDEARELVTNGLKYVDWASTDRKSTRLNSSHVSISYAVFC